MQSSTLYYKIRVLVIACDMLLVERAGIEPASRNVKPREIAITSTAPCRPRFGALLFAGKMDE